MNKRRIEVAQEKQAVRVSQIASGRREPPKDWYDDPATAPTPEQLKKASLAKAERRLRELMGKVGWRYGR